MGSTTMYCLRSNQSELVQATSGCSKRNPSLQWRHNEPNGASNHQPHDCLLRLFRHRSKKIPKRRVSGLCEGNSPVTGEFPSQRTSNAENATIWRRHHDNLINVGQDHVLMNYILLCCDMLCIYIRFPLGIEYMNLFATDSTEISPEAHKPKFCNKRCCMTVDYCSLKNLQWRHIYRNQFQILPKLTYPLLCYM